MIAVPPVHVVAPGTFVTRERVIPVGLVQPVGVTVPGAWADSAELALPQLNRIVPGPLPVGIGPEGFAVSLLVVAPVPQFATRTAWDDTPGKFWVNRVLRAKTVPISPERTIIATASSFLLVNIAVDHGGYLGI